MPRQQAGARLQRQVSRDQHQRGRSKGVPPRVGAHGARCRGPLGCGCSSPHHPPRAYKCASKKAGIPTELLSSNASWPASRRAHAESPSAQRLLPRVLMRDVIARFCRRMDDREGTWQMPQGGIDPAEDPVDAALRELKEETGIENARIVATVSVRGSPPFQLGRNMRRSCTHAGVPTGLCIYETSRVLSFHALSRTGLASTTADKR